MLRLIMSNLATHKDYAGELRSKLEDVGISGFVAHDDIELT